jgi:hypothetical protein
MKISEIQRMQQLAGIPVNEASWVEEQFNDWSDEELRTITNKLKDIHLNKVIPATDAYNKFLRNELDRRDPASMAKFKQLSDAMGDANREYRAIEKECGHEYIDMYAELERRNGRKVGDGSEYGYGQGRYTGD